MGRYPMLTAVKGYLEGVKPYYGESTLRNMTRALRVVHRAFQELKREGKASTTNPTKLTQKDIEELARKMGLVSMLSVPMAVKDRVIGVINCYTSVDHEFTETEKNLFTAVANQAAVAIFNTELMVKTKVIQEELEARKLVGRAKDVLMRRRNMSGEEAHRWIQKRSMDSRKSMREVAEAVLISEEL